MNILIFVNIQQFNCDSPRFRPMSRARDIRDQLKDLLARVDIDPDLSSPSNTIGIQKAILSGYFYHCARINNRGDYKTVILTPRQFYSR